MKDLGYNTLGLQTWLKTQIFCRATNVLNFRGVLFRVLYLHGSLASLTLSTGPVLKMVKISSNDEIIIRTTITVIKTTTIVTTVTREYQRLAKTKTILIFSRKINCHLLRTRS